MRWQAIFKTILILIILVVVMVFFTNLNVYTKNIYSWDVNSIKNSDKMIDVLVKNDINNLYQYFDSTYLSRYDDTFIKNMNDAHIDVYHLAGDPVWGKDKEAKLIIKDAQSVIKFNNHVDNKIRGIVLDIEPYVSVDSEKFSKKDFKLFVKTIKRAYDYYHDNDLELVLCIPYWFDKIDKDLLEELITYTDKIEVMNYDTKKTKKNINREIDYARKHHKIISSVYEIDFNRIDTFKNFKKIEEDYLEIDNNNHYSKFEISYHHYGNLDKED